MFTAIEDGICAFIFVYVASCSEDPKVFFGSVISLIQIYPKDIIRHSDEDIYVKILTKVLFIISRYW